MQEDDKNAKKKRRQRTEKVEKKQRKKPRKENPGQNEMILKEIECLKARDDPQSAESPQESVELFEKSLESSELKLLPKKSIKKAFASKPIDETNLSLAQATSSKGAREIFEEPDDQSKHLCTDDKTVPSTKLSIGGEMDKLRMAVISFVSKTVDEGEKIISVSNDEKLTKFVEMPCHNFNDF